MLAIAGRREDGRVDIPETRYAKTVDGAHIAFQTFGHGEVDLLLIQGSFSNLDANWDVPEIADTLHRLASFARVIAIDRRGMGLSDPLAPGTAQPLEAHVDDVIAVMTEAHVDRACVLASENATPLALALAATHPDRVAALALYAPLPLPLSEAVRRWDDLPERDRAMVFTPEHWRDTFDRTWGTGWAREEFEMKVPSQAGDTEAIARWSRYMRSSASPGSALAFIDHWLITDARSLYPSVQAPTLVMFRPQARPALILERLSTEAAEAIPDARVVTLSGRDMPLWFGDREQLADELEAFFTGVPRTMRAGSERVLATVLFTDIVGSTEHAAGLGDAAWKALVESHHRVVREALADHRGREMDTAGDGFFAVFDGPARAIRCAQAIVSAMPALGIEVRAGLHTGECEVIDGKVGGIAVATGARVAAHADPSEILVSQTVKDLVAGSGVSFTERGSYELKGIPGHWTLYAVADNEPT